MILCKVETRSSMDNWLNINMALTPTLHNVKLVIKEQLHLPAVAVKQPDILGLEIEVVGVVNKRPTEG